MVQFAANGPPTAKPVPGALSPTVGSRRAVNHSQAKAHSFPCGEKQERISSLFWRLVQIHSLDELVQDEYPLVRLADIERVRGFVTLNQMRLHHGQNVAIRFLRIREH